MARMHHVLRIITLALIFLPAGCKEAQDGASTGTEPAVLYCSVDETFAREVIDRYERETGRKVDLVTDTEAGKTTGLVKKLRIEKDRPRADVFWSSEQSQTILLARDGIFAPYESPSAADIPAEFKSDDKLWTGFALRARAVAYDPENPPEGGLPGTWEELAKAEYAGVTSLANPLFGTTRGHMAAMHALWGPERFRAFLGGLVENGVDIADGNSTAVRRVIAGDVKLACTDSDDVVTARAKDNRVEMVFPDMGDGGTMLIPNTVALVKGCAHPEAAKHLIDYLLTPKIEEALARSDSANYPARPALREQLGIELPPASKVTPEQIADSMEPAIAACREILLK